MITVEGYIDAVSYAVQIDPEQRNQRHGVLVDPPNSVIALVAVYDGEEALLTPTGPVVTIDRNDAMGVLGALHAHSDVTSVVGDLPADYPDSDPSVDY